MRSMINAPRWIIILMAVGAALLAGAVIAVVLMTGSRRLLGVAVGGAALLVATYFSGNLRLTCLWGLMLTLPLSFGQRLTAELSPNRGGGESAIRIEFCEIFLLVLVLFLARDLITSAIARLRIPRVLVFWVAIMILGAGVAIFGFWRRAAGYEVIRMVKVLVLFLVICNELRTQRLILHAVVALIASMSLQAVIGLIQYVRGANLGLELFGEAPWLTTEILAQTSVYGGRVWRVSGLVMHPNLFGIFLGVMLPLAIGFFLMRPNGLVRLLCLGGIVAGFVSLIATASRSAWLSFAAGMGVLVVLVVLHNETRRRVLVPLVLASICLVAVSFVFSDAILTRLLQSKEQASIGRELFNEDARRLIAEKPFFGFGLNSYVDVVLPYSDYSRKTWPDWVPPVHHIYNLWAADTGLIGLALHLALIAGVVWTGLGNLRIRDPMMYTINVACLAAIAAFLIDGFFSFSLRTSPLLRLFWVFAGFIVVLRYWRLNYELNRPKPAGRPEASDDLPPLWGHLGRIQPAAR